MKNYLKIKCLSSYYGYPQAEKEYHLENEYKSFDANLTWYGKQGFDLPKINSNGRKTNGFFWGLKLFYEIMGNEAMCQKLRLLKENEEITISYDCYSKTFDVK